MRTTRWCRLMALAMLISTVAPGRADAQTVDPAYRFRTHRTPHFAIYFHQGEERLAGELAVVAEAVWDEMAAQPGVAPPRFTHVVLTDQSDSANGFANPLPRNTITLYATAPTGSDRLNPRDWLRTLFVHEFTHIVHLDRSGGWARLARGLFGRVSWAFPNITLPGWQVEGLATWAESASPGIGRLHAGDFLAVVDEAARAGRLEPLDRANGGLTDWPGGYTQYAYGAGFHRYLADRFGPQAFAELSSATARSLPYFGTLKFKGVYGANLGTLWREYQDGLMVADDADAAPAPRAGRRLTRHGHVVIAPRYLPSTCDNCAPEVAYSIRTPHERPALYRVDVDTLRTTRVTTRILGSTLGIARDGTIYFDQHELHRNVGVYSDLYALDPISARVSALTHGARLTDPDVSPDGRTLVAVQRRHAGQRDLVIVDLAALRSGAAPTSAARSIASDDGVQFNTPRWSPDGRRVVAGRQYGDRPSQIVVVDAVATESPIVTLLTQVPDMRWITPTWRPDGRAVVAAGAAGDAPYNLYDIAIDGGAVRQLTTTTGGATWPDVSADGSTIVYVGYGVEGSDVFEVAYSRDAGASPMPSSADKPAASPAIVGEPKAAPALTSAPYRPWRTLLPTSWTPIILTTGDHLRFGAALGSADVLGYHAYGAAASWAIAPPDMPGQNASIPDWTISYNYRRWQPQLQVVTSRVTTYGEGPPTDEGLATPSTTVEHLTAVGVQLPVLRARFSHALQASVLRLTDEQTWHLGEQSRNRSATRVSWRFSSAEQPGYAISPERGTTLGVASELVRRALGASGNSTTFVADARLYLPGFGRHHVVAARMAGGSSRGDMLVSRVFLLGGGTANAVPGALGSESMSLLRGFAANTFAGRHVALVNVDYRWPIARPQRGLGAWPFMLHTVHAAVVGDVGHVWTRRFDTADIKTSVGGEISANVVLGYYLPLTATMGVAYGHDGSDAARSATTVYGRIGYAF